MTQNGRFGKFGFWYSMDYFSIQNTEQKNHHTTSFLRNHQRRKIFRRLTTVKKKWAKHIIFLGISAQLIELKLTVYLFVSRDAQHLCISCETKIKINDNETMS